MANSTDPTSPVALLLRGDPPSPDDHRLAEILDFFGIPWAALTLSEATGGGVASLIAGHSGFSILTSAPCLAEALRRCNTKMLPGWLTAASSVFVHGFQATDVCRNLLQDNTRDPEANIRSLDGQPLTVSIADDFPEMCGPMSGLHLQLERGAADSVLTIRPAAGEFQSIVAAPEGHLFLRIAHAGVPFFVDASHMVVGIHQRSATYFDVRKCFAGAVPLVMYLKWSFREICWTTQETNACLIVDDPLLTPRYGFLDFRELIALMSQQTFATTIAFIPWNSLRTNLPTITTFHENSATLSLF